MSRECPACRGFHIPGATVDVASRCNNREFCFTAPADLHMLLAQCTAMTPTYGVTLCAYTLAANPDG